MRSQVDAPLCLAVGEQDKVPPYRLRLWIICGVLCRVLVITALVLFYNLNTATMHSFFFSPLSLFFTTQILTQADSEREKDGWHISWGEAANIIWNSSALISMFSNHSRDLYVLPERASILTKPWPWSSSLTAPVSHDRCFSWPPDIFLGSHGPLSGLVNFALSAPQLLAYECPHSHTYSTAVHGAFKKWSF